MPYEAQERNALRCAIAIVAHWMMEPNADENADPQPKAEGERPTPTTGWLETRKAVRAEPGITNAELAERFGVTVKTVREHLRKAKGTNGGDG